MSDNDKSSGAASPQFSERELQLLCWAMQSLKSGPPDIDYDKLAAFASMGNPRSASNAWAKIRAKLSAGTDAIAPTTPRKGGAKKTKATAANEEGEEGEATPKKTPRKRAAKKQDVDGDASPKKKGRGKKVSDDETNVKSEPEEPQDVKLDVAPMEDIEDEV
ncbi:uncharacterized protein K460DRAFT_381206 [Cucurbitaria berberidis CBS 394.84]|uniref:Uncharacterized protein n=1 Tax=Cucurbitaria berberidis CBS 394.84 TaxID=1168544 RepID=A0A9P4G7Y3_9PLEO|nr:uncharacterized protein K460DRAFT_381206 [Cucurbitaria berberidis CBS 394.84]KAF1840399.1 hypothetical protein K460DRAFT_381206 [Cucurbitaria berberidis CBS 394.84]